MNALGLIGAYSDKVQARKAAERTSGILFTANAADTAHLPFAALVMAVTDELGDFVEQADVGTYLVCARTIKNLPLSEFNQRSEPDQQSQPGAVGIFTLIANPELGPSASDRHWRDNHAPLALQVHVAMTHYYQLSIQHVFKGPVWNGFALCCFASEDDLRNRFFDTPAGEKAIARDVAYFADTRKSPRRVIATMELCK